MEQIQVPYENNMGRIANLKVLKYFSYFHHCFLDTISSKLLDIYSTIMVDSS